MSIHTERTIWLVTLFMISRATGQSVNRPVLCSASLWDPNATTFANESIVGQQPTAIFITVNNSIYVVDQLFDQVHMWLGGSTTPTMTIAGNMSSPFSVFVANNDDIYVSHNASGGQVDRWSSNATYSTMVMNESDVCYSLFIAQNNTLYCSMSDLNQVVIMPLDSAWNTTTTAVIGDPGRAAGSSPAQLNRPHGIFVDRAFYLYVADTGNDRIQRFSPGQTSGVTLIDSRSNTTMTLNEPRAVILDSIGYIFIADTGNHRIIGGGRNGFRCVAGCTNTYGSAANELNAPSSLSFDSYGNLFVVDQNNSRIQKFLRMQDPCGRSFNLPSLCSYAIWKSDGITVTNSSSTNENYSVFVDVFNKVYAAGLYSGDIQVWAGANMTLARNISVASTLPRSVFASIIGDIYVDNGLNNSRVDQWSPNATSSVPAVNVSSPCDGLFIDDDYNLYCSMSSEHRVLKQSLSNYEYPTVVVAGTGSPGSAPDMLNHPAGLFFDLFYWYLYVADCRNNRIQRFQSGLPNGTTLAGNGIPNGAQLNCPVGVAMDYAGYLFVVEMNNHRIVRVGDNGLRCIAGCTGSAGSASNQLIYPFSLSFDSLGNLFVADSGNGRVQKFMLTINGCSPPFNKPNFCPLAAWNPNATTIANVSDIGSGPHRLFVDSSNTLYVADWTNSRVQVWLKGNSTPTRTIQGGLNAPCGIFVTINGDIYVDNGFPNGRVDRWSLNATNSTAVMKVTGACFSIFVDVDENLYCSMDPPHQVVKRSLSKPINISTVVAGIGTAGSGPNMLNGPRGIYVLVASSSVGLYVADCWNNRIQYFRIGKPNGTTIAINGPQENFTLYCPTDVALDNNNYLFIVDGYHNRILGSGPAGFRCIAACGGVAGGGSRPDQLLHPHSLSFDSDGNLFIADTSNNRIQKFYFQPDSCGKTITTEMAVVTTTDTSELRTTTEQVMTTISQNVRQTSQSFVLPVCPLPSQMGSTCNLSSAPCDAYKPCQNQGTCLNLNSTTVDYRCLCASGFSGTECQIDSRPCQPTTCWNKGVCQASSNTSFICRCPSGWTGLRCQTKINFCENITCLNQGVCRPLLLNFSCECLGDSYSGRVCQTTSSKTTAYQIVAKSFGYIAIIALTSVALLIIVLDVLKYGFGIDVAEKHIRRRIPKKRTKRTKPSAGIRFIYVNAPASNSMNQSFVNIGTSASS